MGFAWAWLTPTLLTCACSTVVLPLLSQSWVCGLTAPHLDWHWRYGLHAAAGFIPHLGLYGSLVVRMPCPAAPLVLAPLCCPEVWPWQAMGDGQVGFRADPMHFGLFTGASASF